MIKLTSPNQLSTLSIISFSFSLSFRLGKLTTNISKSAICFYEPIKMLLVIVDVNIDSGSIKSPNSVPVKLFLKSDRSG